MWLSLCGEARGGGSEGGWERKGGGEDGREAYQVEGAEALIAGEGREELRAPSWPDRVAG